jgi:hypothetical protein
MRYVRHFNKYTRPWSPRSIGVVLFLLLLVSGFLFVLIISGKIRKPATASTLPPLIESATTSQVLVPRRLDGVMVPAGQDMLPPRAIMVENHPDARPLSGVAKANVVIEAPVEGGITRFLLLFDATTTVQEVGPVRSARPYYVDWADAWHAAYFHVGGSPDALQQIRQRGASFANIDEMVLGRFFWRSLDRSAPHNAYTSKDLMDHATIEKRLRFFFLASDLAFSGRGLVY